MGVESRFVGVEEEMPALLVAWGDFDTVPTRAGAEKGERGGERWWCDDGGRKVEIEQGGIGNDGGGGEGEGESRCLGRRTILPLLRLVT